MKKQSNWRFFLILSVICLTLYNVLPTVFYYARSSVESVSFEQKQKIAQDIQKRIACLQKESLDWLSSFCQLIQISPESIEVSQEHPDEITLIFKSPDLAARFRSHFSKASSLIYSKSLAMQLVPSYSGDTQVRVQRSVHETLQEKDFLLCSKQDEDALILDRVSWLGALLGGKNPSSLWIEALQEGAEEPGFLEALAAEIQTVSQMFENSPPLAARYASCLMKGTTKSGPEVVSLLLKKFDEARDQFKKIKTTLSSETSQKNRETLSLLSTKEDQFILAQNFLKKHSSLFVSKQKPLSYKDCSLFIQKNGFLNLDNRHPLFEEIRLDPVSQTIVLKLHDDVLDMEAKGSKFVSQFLMNELAKLQRVSQESLVRKQQEVLISFATLPDATSSMALKLDRLGRQAEEKLVKKLHSLWQPQHPDLASMEKVDAASYFTLPKEKQKLCFVVLAPVAQQDVETGDLKASSLYLVAKGLDEITRNCDAFPDAETTSLFKSDMERLVQLLEANGFRGFQSPTNLGSVIKKGDLFFEKAQFMQPLLQATRENFILRGSQKHAVLEFSNKAHRILTENKIETDIQNELLKWEDDYRSHQVHTHQDLRFVIPRPTKSVFWNNLVLSAKKFFRGDERKIIRWGLDLSGGKTVQIELKDANQKRITEDADIQQGMQELRERVNKMGLSEVTLRQLGHQIVLDFPGSQGFSASELIRASTLYFHVVNETFSSLNPSFAAPVNRFLQEVWNEASILGQTTPQDVSRIAYQHLHVPEGSFRSEAAKHLWDQGLRLGNPEENNASALLDESLSKVVMWKGSDSSDWLGQAHPLLIVFQNYSLEGSSLENIQSSYDSSKGNYLSFDVKKSSQHGVQKKINPRELLRSWTSKFSKEGVCGTPLELSSRGKGWRMAVVLNDFVINAPTLESALDKSAMISGHFSQRETAHLVSDLKAGSLSFTPHILSEKNVSPELGKTDRVRGIGATLIAFAAVVACMMMYYRFAGLVASIAVLFNLLILWATLQNLGATLTLAGLAGVILTVGMAVDANVLVFERIREEFEATGRIRTAIEAGYQKAYSAILDSNVTTVIAALILLNFDAGPIKSFAVNLIIGIVSSMFTALFMTRFYFSKWVENPKHVALNMRNWIRNTTIPFLKYTKIAVFSALITIGFGGAFLWAQKDSMLGMDFTGGYALNLELTPSNRENEYIESVEKALLNAGAASSDFQVRTLSPAHHVRILIGTSLEQPGKPFHLMPFEIEKESGYKFQKNPRIQWVVESLHREGVELSPDSLAGLDQNWTSMSGQISSQMRNHAMIGFFISFICIFIYLAVRFEYKFASAALLCLVHDVLITLSVMAILHAFGMNIHIDLNTIAALMTIIGYSLNDTIIIFDRIREEMKIRPQKNLFDVVNTSLNATLSRTMMTSGTTLLVLIVLVLFGGPSIFNFSLVMAVGVFLGTLSSLFIASPLMLFFHRRESAIQEIIQER